MPSVSSIRFVPCQPWSIANARRGHRALLAMVTIRHGVVPCRVSGNGTLFVMVWASGGVSWQKTAANCLKRSVVFCQRSGFAKYGIIGKRFRASDVGSSGQWHLACCGSFRLVGIAFGGALPAKGESHPTPHKPDPPVAEGKRCVLS